MSSTIGKFKVGIGSGPFQYDVVISSSESWLYNGNDASLDGLSVGRGLLVEEFAEQNK